MYVWIDRYFINPEGNSMYSAATLMNKQKLKFLSFSLKYKMIKKTFCPFQTKHIKAISESKEMHFNASLFVGGVVLV